MLIKNYNFPEIKPNMLLINCNNSSQIIVVPFPETKKKESVLKRSLLFID